MRIRLLKGVTPLNRPKLNDVTFHSIRGMRNFGQTHF